MSPPWNNNPSCIDAIFSNGYHKERVKGDIKTETWNVNNLNLAEMDKYSIVCNINKLLEASQRCN